MIPANMNTIQQNLLRNIQQNNPQGYQFINQLKQNGGDINPVVKQMLSKIAPQQKQQVLNTLKSYGAPDSYLSQLQNMK